MALRTCPNCPDFQTCTKLCDKIIAMLPEEEPEPPSEQAWVDINAFFSQETGNDNDLAYQNETVEYTEDNNSPEEMPEKGQEEDEKDYRLYDTLPLLSARSAKLPDLEPITMTNESFNKILNKYDIIFKNRVDKSYFKSFILCDTLTRIAKRAGCTKQNMLKIYVNWMGKIAQLMTKGKSIGKEVTTPKQFKESLLLYEP